MVCVLGEQSMERGKKRRKTDGFAEEEKQDGSQGDDGTFSEAAQVCM